MVLDFTNPQIWWYLTRASAMIAWVLLTLTMVWGILLTTRVLRGADNPEWLKVTHRYISGLAMVMIVTHIGTLLLDDYINFGWADVLIPFATNFEPLPVALGIIAFWLIVAIQLTALGARWLPEALWKSIHITSYLAIVAIALHSGLVGTDVGTPWYTVVSLILITTVTLAGIVRLIIAGREKPKRLADTALAAASAPAQVQTGFEARVVERTPVGEKIVQFTLTPVDQSLDLEWEAGAHTTLHLGNGLERQYSLAGDPAEQNTLVIGVLNTGGEGGGSAWIHDHLSVGDVIRCEMPRNHFPLKPARRYQFVASGIGITPIRSMVDSIPASREWSLLYLGRNREDMLFADELERLFGDHVTVWATGEKGTRANLRELIDPSADVYGCGSEEMLRELELQVAPRRLHLERFEPITRVSNSSVGSFELTLNRSGTTVEVPETETMLESLERAGVTVQASCRRGVCGTCEVSVLRGEPEHLDSVMSDADKDELGIVYPCVSRSRTPSLTLDV